MPAKTERWRPSDELAARPMFHGVDRTQIRALRFYTFSSVAHVIPATKTPPDHLRYFPGASHFRKQISEFCGVLKSYISDVVVLKGEPNQWATLFRSPGPMIAYTEPK